MQSVHTTVCATPLFTWQTVAAFFGREPAGNYVNKGDGPTVQLTWSRQLRTSGPWADCTRLCRVGIGCLTMAFN